MLSKDNELVLMDAMLYAMEGKSPSQAIENQERRGQADVVRNRRLPKYASAPDEIRNVGCDAGMSWEEKEKIWKENLAKYAREKYATHGITITGDYDDLFYNVTLPENWEIRATEHAMWNELVNADGKVIANFFYKAAFYDRHAFICFVDE